MRTEKSRPLQAKILRRLQAACAQTATRCAPSTTHAVCGSPSRK